MTKVSANRIYTVIHFASHIVGLQDVKVRDNRSGLFIVDNTCQTLDQVAATLEKYQAFLPV